MVVDQWNPLALALIWLATKPTHYYAVTFLLPEPYITKVKFLAGGYLPPLWHFGRGGVLPQKKILEGGYWGGYQIPKFFRDFFAGIFFFAQ